MKAAHQEELNNIFSTITETQHRNTHLEAELHKHTISKQAQKKNLSVRK